MFIIKMCIQNLNLESMSKMSPKPRERSEREREGGKESVCVCHIRGVEVLTALCS